MKSPFVDFALFDCDRPVISREEIMKVNPHRFEMFLLDGVAYVTDQLIVGFKDVMPDEFWVRGHFPERPLMPGVLMCECAAQLSSYFALTHNMVTDGSVGLGGLEEVRFRAPVVPGDRLVVMMKRGKSRQNVIFSSEFQGFVEQTMVVEGIIKGVVLPNH